MREGVVRCRRRPAHQRLRPQAARQRGRRHFLRRTGLTSALVQLKHLPLAERHATVASRLTQAVCPAADWTDGEVGREGCTLAMSEGSVRLVRDVWRHAPNWTAPWPEDDDVVHMISHGNGPRREGRDATFGR